MTKWVNYLNKQNSLVSWGICCVSVQGLHPLKDSAFVVFEGESFRETLIMSAIVTCDCLVRSISWLRHQMFYP